MILLALVVGVALRFHQLGSMPHGIYHDEAYYGLDAVSVLEGARPIFFTANNGREPLHIYILSLSLAAFGRTPFGLRLASAMIGTLTIPMTFLLGRALFNRRVGLLAMAICAVTFWPVALSRVSFRAGALPLFLGLAIALGWLGLKRRNVLLAILGGVAYGLAFNTYTAARVTPLAFALTAAIVVWRYLPRRHEDTKNENFAPSRLRGFPSRELLAFLISTVLVLVPLGIYALAHPAQVFAREGQVSIFETENGTPFTALVKHAALAVGMFGWHGDTIPRHNLPGRPVFDLWTFALFVVGLALTAIRSRRSLPSAFLVVWTAVMLLPTVLAEDTPHFLRAIGLLPVLWLIPAIAFDALVDSPNLTGLRRPVRFMLTAALLLASALTTARDYFVRYASDSNTGYYFESAATDLAVQINSRADFATRIDSRLWDNFASLRFLIPNRNGSGATDRVQLAVWPYEPDEVRAAVADLPPNSLISARRGELAKGDLEATPYSLYTLYIAEPARDESVTARFGEILELRAAEVADEGEQFRIRLHWAAAHRAPIKFDYHIYVHVVEGGKVSAQADGEPLNGLYHFSWLRPGDVLNDEYVLPKGEQVLVGLYTPDGAPLGEPVELK